MLAGAVAAVVATLVLHGTPSRATVRPLAPPAMGEARPARVGSATEVARVSGNAHPMRRAAEPRRARTVTSMSSAGRSPAVGVPAPAVTAVSGAGSSPRLEPAEFGFER
jgi:hypothetical protein